MDLFNSVPSEHQPLAEKIRPKTLDEIVGQSPIDVKSKLGQMIRGGIVPSMILWGPPGTGKTTFALALAHATGTHFESINAVDSGVKVLKEKGDAARDKRLQFGQKSVLFVDEIHRFNKGQQDVLLPYMERGDLILVGATTENPSYELNKALLSRTRVVVFNSLSRSALELIQKRVSEFYSLPPESFVANEAIDFIFQYADGDARRFINAWELIYSFHQVQPKESLSLSDIKELLQTGVRHYDKNSEQHYDLISAFIKSVRGSDPDAAIYYLARMIDGGEDPVFIARRLIILASEDVGNADPRALSMAVSCLQALEAIGFPEGAITLAQVTTYLASAPKSNSSYLAIKKAQALVEQTGSLPVPLSLRSAQTSLAKELGYGKDYQYPHDQQRAWAEQDYLPEAIKGQILFEPNERGFEKTMKEYLRWVRQTKS